MTKGAHRRLLAGVLIAVGVLSASAAQAQVSVVITWHQPDIRSFYLSDFSPTDTGSHPDLFTVGLVNSGGVPVSVELELEIRRETSVLLQARTGAFTLDPGPRLLTNRELPRTEQEYTLKDYEITDTAENLAERTLQTGLLPSGRYTFELRAFAGGTQSLLGSGNHVITVSNPSRVDLIAPGSSFGATLPVVATLNPQFFWTSDALEPGTTAAGQPTLLAARFRLRVVKVDDASSGEEAIQRFPVWEQIAEGRTNEFYPSSVQAIPLEPGATYAWQVERLVVTSGGTREIESDIYWFQIEDPGAGVFGAGVDQEVQNMMEQISDLQGMGDQLKGYQPAGQVLVDGVPVNTNALKELLARIVQGQVQVTSIIIR